MTCQGKFWNIPQFAQHLKRIMLEKFKFTCPKFYPEAMHIFICKIFDQIPIEIESSWKEGMLGFLFGKVQDQMIDKI